MIINIKGTQCSGKSTVIHNITSEHHIYIFDVLDLWIEYDCINANETMDWAKWQIASLELPYRLHKFLEGHETSIKIVEHGCNAIISNILNEYKNKYNNVLDIELKIPNDKILEERALLRELNPNRVKDFAINYRRKYAGPDITTVSQERAIKLMNNAINGTQINYITGSVLEPTIKGNKIICHVCNDIGGWGSGFVLAISNKWHQPENAYRKWFRSGENFELGFIQIVKTEEEMYVANMIAQHKTINLDNNPIPIKYYALETCLNKLADKALQLKASIHMPRIGCGLAKGKWSEVEIIIKKTLIAKGIDVYVYTIERDNSWTS